MPTNKGEMKSPCSSPASLCFFSAPNMGCSNFQRHWAYTTSAHILLEKPRTVSKGGKIMVASCEAFMLRSCLKEKIEALFAVSACILFYFGYIGVSGGWYISIYFHIRKLPLQGALIQRSISHDFLIQCLMMKEAVFGLYVALNEISHK